MTGRTIRDFRGALERRKGRQEQLLKSQVELKQRITSLGRDIRRTEKALALLQDVAQQTQEKLKYHITEIVSLALMSIFDDPYEFGVDFVVKRGKTEAELYFKRGEDVSDPMTSTGGGVVDVAAFALRVAMYRLRSPRLRPVIALDEPFRFLSTNLQPKASELLKELSAELGLQFIIITHEEELVDAADKVFHVSQTKGKSRITAA